jgi:hypothetical protein
MNEDQAERLIGLVGMIVIMLIPLAFLCAAHLVEMRRRGKI